MRRSCRGQGGRGGGNGVRDLGPLESISPIRPLAQENPWENNSEPQSPPPQKTIIESVGRILSHGIPTQITICQQRKKRCEDPATPDPLHLYDLAGIAAAGRTETSGRTPRRGRRTHRRQWQPFAHQIRGPPETRGGGGQRGNDGFVVR